MITFICVLAIASAAARLFLFAALHVVPSAYNPLTHAVSDYAVGPTRHLSTAMTWTTVLTWLSLAAAVSVVLPSWEYHGTATALLLTLAIIFAVLPFVPTDLAGAKRTPRGILHYVLAIAWFAIAYSLTGDTSRYMATSWGGISGSAAVALHWIALISLIALIAALVVPTLRRYFGLAERVFIAAISVFFLIAAIALLAHA
ncbi:DUF998 domain-containing protein [Spelaeicoccus albus]|uniref:DUF998 domain-containing protein n=1 Tax=Spelaeicoccus albus TaxID=1280376 RepID=A0A7Z0D380_9MICO|nr:DUF998 domain-containing protein [Spelaeicoccus albus]NYI68049.1 hypothetical protein [Spelaeicoccus albus]